MSTKGSATAAGAATGNPYIAAAGAVVDVVGMFMGASAADKAAEESKQQAKRQLKYDQDARNMQWDKLNADRQWAIEGNKIKARNEKRIALWKDATNAASYIQKLQIRNMEQNSLDMQFAKSNLLYDEQIDFNDRAAKTAADSEWRQLDEINSEAAFDAQEQRIQYMQAEGKARAAGASGRSAAKTSQAALASFGMQVAMLNEGIASAGRNTRAMLEEIKNDQYSANLAAFAQKMLDPGELPMPIVPFKTPMAEFQDPRPLDKDFDIGPEPILGGYTSRAAASQAFWGAAIPGIASSAIGVGDAFGLFK